MVSKITFKLKKQNHGQLLAIKAILANLRASETLIEPLRSAQRIFRILTGFYLHLFFAVALGRKSSHKLILNAKNQKSLEGR